VKGSKGDEMSVESSGLVQMESLRAMLGAALPIPTSPHNFSKGASLSHGSTNVNSSNRPSEASSIALALLIEISPISFPMH